jgi:hypothetical protein
VKLYIHSPYTLSWRGAPLKTKTHRDNFTFTFYLLLKGVVPEAKRELTSHFKYLDALQKQFMLHFKEVEASKSEWVRDLQTKDL